MAAVVEVNWGRQLVPAAVGGCGCSCCWAAALETLGAKSQPEGSLGVGVAESGEEMEAGLVLAVALMKAEVDAAAAAVVVVVEGE